MWPVLEPPILEPRPLFPAYRYGIGKLRNFTLFELIAYKLLLIILDALIGCCVGICYNTNLLLTLYLHLDQWEEHMACDSWSWWSR